MDTNARIIRDERDEAPIFEESSRSTPRIDLILGVALAVVAGAIGVLSSLGLGAAGAQNELLRPNTQIAGAEAERAAPATLEPARLEPGFLEAAPIVVAAPDAEAGKAFLFERADAPAILLDKEQDASRARIERALACLDAVRRDAEDDGEVDGRRVIRFLGAATSAAMDDAEFDAAIDEVTVTIESIIEEMESPRLPEPVWTMPERVARPRALRLPTRTIGL